MTQLKRFQFNLWNEPHSYGFLPIGFFRPYTGYILGYYYLLYRLVFEMSKQARKTVIEISESVPNENNYLLIIYIIAIYIE